MYYVIIRNSKDYITNKKSTAVRPSLRTARQLRTAQYTVCYGKQSNNDAKLIAITVVPAASFPAASNRLGKHHLRRDIRQLIVHSTLMK